MSQTFYPSLDGVVVHHENRVLFTVLRVAAGTDAEYTGTTTRLFYILSDTVTDRWDELERGIFLFDTSALGADAIISAAVFSVYGSSKLDDLGLEATCNVGLFGSNPAADNELVPGDFDSVDGTYLSDTVIDFAGFSLTGYNDFPLNAAGLSAINKTGITKFGTRNNEHDRDGDAIPWTSDKDSYLFCYAAENGTNKPKLVVTYTMPDLNVSVGDCSDMEDVYDPH